MKDDNCYGDDMEYAVFEMIQMGTIPMLDWNAGNACHMYDENTVRTNESMLELGVGIFLKKDLSNIDECIAQMNELMDDPVKYDEMRNKIYDAFVANCNPKSITNKLIEDIFA